MLVGQRVLFAVLPHLHLAQFYGLLRRDEAVPCLKVADGLSADVLLLFALLCLQLCPFVRLTLVGVVILLWVGGWRGSVRIRTLEFRPALRVAVWRRLLAIEILSSTVLGALALTSAALSVLRRLGLLGFEVFRPCTHRCGQPLVVDNVFAQLLIVVLLLLLSFGGSVLASVRASLDDGR